MADEVATPLTRALAAIEANDAFMDLTESEGYVDTGDAFEQLHALRGCIHELMMTPGTKVKMTDGCKSILRAAAALVGVNVDEGGPSHVDEFGDCIGIVQGPVDYTGPSCQIKQFGPEVDVRWLPSNLRYMYKPEHLEIIQ